MANSSIYYRTAFAVGGMTCSSCVQSIKNTVSLLSHRIFSVNVSLESESATVKHAREITTDAICRSIIDAGFDCSVTESERLSFHESHYDVVGMTCDSCVHTIRRGLLDVDGVLRVDLSLSERLASVEHDVNVLPDVLAERIREMGFDAYPACRVKIADKRGQGV